MRMRSLPLFCCRPASRILAACKAIAESEELNKNAQSKMSILGVKELTKQCKSKKVAELRKWLATSGL